MAGFLEIQTLDEPWGGGGQGVLGPSGFHAGAFSQLYEAVSLFHMPSPLAFVHQYISWAIVLIGEPNNRAKKTMRYSFRLHIILSFKVTVTAILNADS